MRRPIMEESIMKLEAEIIELTSAVLELIEVLRNEWHRYLSSLFWYACRFYMVAEHQLLELQFCYRQERLVGVVWMIPTHILPTPCYWCSEITTSFYTVNERVFPHCGCDDDEWFIPSHLPLLRNRPNWTQCAHSTHEPLFRLYHQTHEGLGDEFWSLW